MDYANAVIAQIYGKDHENEVNILVKIRGVPSRMEAVVKMYPDTGASICVAGMHLLNKIGLKLSNLRQTFRNIKTATSDKIHCMGFF